MPSAEDFEETLRLARQLLEPSWKAYTDFLKLRGQGLRQPALRSLETFVTTAQTWNFDERWGFAEALLSHLQSRPLLRLALPEPLVKGILRPTLKEALTRFLTDPRPAYWLGHEGIFAWEAEAGDHQQLAWMREALRRDTDFQPARDLFVSLLLYSIFWGQHELPAGYLGQPSEDIQALQEGREVLSKLDFSTRRQQLTQDLEDAEKTARQYLRFQKSGAAFYRFWCDENGLPYRYGTPASPAY